jgi:hypothetical protein
VHSRPECDETGISEDFKVHSPKDGCAPSKCEKPNNDGLLGTCALSKGGNGQNVRSPLNDELGLSRRRIQELADWYSDQGHQRYSEDRLDTAELDAELRLILREEVAFPEHIEIEFERVIQRVFAV